MPRRPELYRMAMLDLYCDSFPIATSPWISTRASIGASRNCASSTPITMTFCRSTSSTPAAGWSCPCCGRRRRRAILALVKRVVGHLRERFPRVRIRLRGDSHYACPEVMSWCEARGIEYIFGLSGTAPLAAQVQTLEARTAARYAARRAAEPPKFKLRRYMDFRGSPGTASAGSLPGSKRGPMGSTPATSSPT
jgi:Transposase DDE domain group 1